MVLKAIRDEIYIYTVSTFDAYQNNHDMAILNSKMHLEGIESYRDNRTFMMQSYHKPLQKHFDYV